MHRSPEGSGIRERGEKSDSEEKVVEEPHTVDASAGGGRGKRSDSEENVKEVPGGKFFYLSVISSRIWIYDR